MECHLQLLKQEFEYHFSDLDDSELLIWNMSRNPFLFNEDILPNNLQDEFLELKCNSTAKDSYKAMPFDDFWAKYMHIRKNLGRVAFVLYFRFRPLMFVNVAFLHL